MLEEWIAVSFCAGPAGRPASHASKLSGEVRGPTSHRSKSSETNTLMVSCKIQATQ